MSCFSAFEYATTPPVKASELPAMAVRAAATIPPVHDSAVAPDHPRGSQQVEDDLGQWPLVGREHVLAELGPHLRGERLSGLLMPRIGPDVDLDLEAPRADGRLDARRVASGRPVDVGDVRLADAVRAHEPAGPRRGAREHLRQRRVAGRVLPEAAELRRHARQDDDDGPVDGQDEARRGSRHPEHGRSIRHVRLLSVSGVETGPVEPVADGDLIGPAVDPLEDVCIEHQVDAGDVRERLDGAVVVGGPEPT